MLDAIDLMQLNTVEGWNWMIIIVGVVVSLFRSLGSPWALREGGNEWR